MLVWSNDQSICFIDSHNLSASLCYLSGEVAVCYLGEEQHVVLHVTYGDTMYVSLVHACLYHWF